MAKHFIKMGHYVKASASSEDRLPELSSIKCEPFIINIESLPKNTQTFLKADILIVNIPSKDIDAFTNLTKEIAKSDIENVLFVSSTSVYENNSKVISESDGEESTTNPLIKIENLFKNIGDTKTTIVRFGGLIGYSRNPGKFFARGRIVQDPDSNVNLIHRDDCIGIISNIVEQEAWGEVFNCCADTHPTKREFYTQATKSSGGTIPMFATSGTKSFKIISNLKVKQYLKYEFLHPDLMKIKFNT